MKKLTFFAMACITMIILIMAGALWWLIHNYAETGKPTISLNSPVRAVGRSKIIGLTVQDANSGLRAIQVALLQDRKSHLLASLAYPKRGIREKSLTVTIDPASLKLHEGAANLRIVATDYSLLKNERLLEQPLIIDVRPPLIFVMNPVNNINTGGTGVIVHKTSEPAVTTGVQVGDLFYPSSPTLISGQPAFITYFAMPFHADKSRTGIRIVARDEAGNESLAAVPFLVKNKKFRSDKIVLSDKFLQQKMPEFESAYPSLKGKSPLEVFRYVNEQLRSDNEQTIRALCRNVTPKQLWHDAFLRMKNASPMALFGDSRTNLYQGKVVGESVHFGIDLASTAHAAIEAANRGIVVFTGMLGIYGNTIIIDHGLGLHSLYGHLSAIQVQKGQSVKRGEPIGVSGTTGLAVGDHLHFSIIVGGQFVNPQEWWDAHWIRDNVSSKMEIAQ